MKICVVGLGYVGLPLAVAFAEKKIDVIGFDINSKKIEKYLSGIDVTEEVGNQRLIDSKLNITNNIQEAKDCKVFIIAVPTPTNEDKLPDLNPIISSVELISPIVKKGDIIVFESTVYPGITEDVCGPLLEKNTGFKCGVDIFLGYSPERINPGDKVHRLETITKVVSGQNKETLDILCSLYGTIIDAGIHPASSIKVAEAAKVIENAQRDINIAFMNELSIIFNKLGINTKDVLEAANTKWNFLDFKPGLVGGHCIGVDPYYLSHCAIESGIAPEVILAGRNRNDGMANNVVIETTKRLSTLNKPLKDCKVAVLGITFKENCPDTRNSKVTDIVKGLKEFSINVSCSDEIADGDYDKEVLGDLQKFEDIENCDALIIAVKHDYIVNFDKLELLKKIENSKIVIDLKWIFEEDELEGYKYYQM